MSPRQLRVPLLGALTCALLTAPVRADDDYRRPGLTGRWVSRGLTAPMNSLTVVAGPGNNPLLGQRLLTGKGRLRTIDGGGSYVRLSPSGESEAIRAREDQWWLRAGVIFGLTDDWEAGALFLPFLLDPEFDFTEVLAYGTRAWRFENVDIGARLSLQTPELEVWKLNPAFTLRYRFDNIAALDTSVTVPFGTKAPLYIGVNVPVRFTFNVGPHFFLGLESGFYHMQFDDDHGSTLPLGALTGLSFLWGDRLFDFTAQFSYDSFLLFTPEPGVDTAQTDSFRTVFGLSMHRVVK